MKFVDAYLGQNRPRSPPNQAQKIDFIGGIDRSPGPLHLYVVRLIYCALLTPYGAEFARIRRHFCSQICWWPIDLVDDFIEPPLDPVQIPRRYADDTRSIKHLVWRYAFGLKSSVIT